MIYFLAFFFPAFGVEFDMGQRASSLIIIFLFQSQKKRVAEEEAASRRMGLHIRLLPVAEEDTATASQVKFSTKFDRNRKDKRALINASSIFPGSSGTSMANKKALELESKRRKISAAAASSLLAGRVKPLSWSQNSISSSRHKGPAVKVRRF